MTHNVAYRPISHTEHTPDTPRHNIVPGSAEPLTSQVHHTLTPLAHTYTTLIASQPENRHGTCMFFLTYPTAPTRSSVEAMQPLDTPPGPHDRLERGRAGALRIQGGLYEGARRATYRRPLGGASSMFMLLFRGYRRICEFRTAELSARRLGGILLDDPLLKLKAAVISTFGSVGLATG